MIEDANVIISTYDSSEASSLQVDPTQGTVAFGSGYFGWAFTLNRFARNYAQKFKIDEKLLIKRLWGDNYYNPAFKRFQKTDQTESSSQLQRAFCQFIMKPILQLSRNIMSEN